MIHYIKSGFFFVLLCLISSQSTAVNRLFNYIGDGASPRLHLELAENNGPGWDAYSIDYQGSAEVPWSGDASKQWSAWDVKDEVGNYFGTVNFSSDGNTTQFVGYSCDLTPGYCLDLVFGPIKNSKNYQLTAKKVTDVGPLPRAGVAKPAVYPGTDTPIVLSVVGANIVNNKGVPIVLKGVVRPSLEWNRRGQYLSENDIFTMRQWGANVIRINLHQELWMNSEPLDKKGSYKQIVDAMIYYAIQQNMAVILDLHISGNNNMANRRAIDFWKQVAWQYKDFGTVLFELFNEPVGVSKEIWLNGDTDKSTYAGYQELLDATRGVGANNICIINGLDWGYDLSFVNQDFGVKGTNIVYGSHPYNDKGSDGWTYPGGSFKTNFAGILGKYPIIFTEFGDNQPKDYLSGKDKQVYERILKYIVEENIHYTGFAWWVENGNPAFPALISDWSGTPLNGGEQVKADIDLRPGTAIDALK